MKQLVRGIGFCGVTLLLAGCGAVGGLLGGGGLGGGSSGSNVAPISLAVTKEGTLLYAPGPGRSLIKYDAKMISDLSVADGTTLSTPVRAAVDTGGAIYVAESDTTPENRIEKFAPNLLNGATSVATLDKNGGAADIFDFSKTAGLATLSQGSSTTLYVLDQKPTGTYRITQLTSASANSLTLSAGPTPLTGVTLTKPTAIGVDSSGRVYVADDNGSQSRVVRLISSGANWQPDTFSVKGVSLLSATDIALGSTGRIYVVDNAANALRILDSNGQAQNIPITLKPSTPAFSNLLAVTVDATGNVFLGANPGAVGPVITVIYTLSPTP